VKTVSDDRTPKLDLHRSLLLNGVALRAQLQAHGFAINGFQEAATELVVHVIECANNREGDITVLQFAALNRH
jgi:hypothetical protein